MSDFLVSIDDIVTNIISVETSSLELSSLEQGILELEINNSIENNILTIESSILETIGNLEIQKYNDYNLTVSNSIYGQLPDSIPMSIIDGNLDVSRIDGLDEYLSTIPIDGGSP